MTDPVGVWLCNLADAVTWTVDLVQAALLFDSEALTMKIKSYFPVTMQIDDEDIVLHVRRMSSVDISEFETTMLGFGYSFDGTPASKGAQDQVNSRDMAVWTEKVISDNITVPPGQLSIEDEYGVERELRTGAELVAQFGGRVDFIPSLVAFIWGENRLSKRGKVDFRATVGTAMASIGGGLAAPAVPAVPMVAPGVTPPPADAPPPVAPSVQSVQPSFLQ